MFRCNNLITTKLSSLKFGNDSYFHHFDKRMASRIATSKQLRLRSLKVGVNTCVQAGL